jgi:hypothetical protein
MAGNTEVEQQTQEAEEVEEAALNHAFKLGIATGMENVGNALLKKAGETFAAGNNDSFAQLLRSIALEIISDATSKNRDISRPKL